MVDRPGRRCGICLYRSRAVGGRRRIQSGLAEGSCAKFKPTFGPLRLGHDFGCRLPATYRCIDGSVGNSSDDAGRCSGACGSLRLDEFGSSFLVLVARLFSAPLSGPRLTLLAFKQYAGDVVSRQAGDRGGVLKLAGDFEHGISAADTGLEHQ